MSLTLIRTIAVCECCALVIASGDDSGCRDYYGHAHPTPNLPADASMTDDGADQPSRPWTCGACGTGQDSGAYRMWAAVLETEWSAVLEEVDPWQREAVLAWVASGDYVAEGTGDLPSLPDFEERYAGEWDTFRAYAENLADDIGLLQGMPNELTPYFDWAAWARDLAYDYTTHPAPGGGVFVFRSL